MTTATSRSFRSLFDGHHSHVTNGIELALGRSARDFRDYARDKREPWAPSGKLA